MQRRRPTPGRPVEFLVRRALDVKCVAAPPGLQQDLHTLAGEWLSAAIWHIDFVDYLPSGCAGAAASAGQSIALLTRLGFPRAAVAGETRTKVNLASLVRETQRMSPKADEITLAWWTPVEYWEACLSQNPLMAPEQTAQFTKVVLPCTTVAIVEGTVGVLGGMTFKSEAEVRTRVKLRDKDGETYAPIEPAELSPDLSSLLALMKPMLANAMGPLGRNMHFLVFPAKDKQGRRIADARKEGSFAVLVGEKKYRWKLPLGSLLPPKSCPECAEELSGAFKFCPYDGTKLPEKKE